MKKILAILVLGLFLSSCSGGLPSLPNLTNLLATSTVPTPADTSTPQPTVTLLPTLDLFATSTPTPVTFTPTETSFVPDIPELLPTGTPLPLPTFSQEFINDVTSTTFFVQSVGFRAVMYSDAILYWNQGPCTTRSIKITALVEDPTRPQRVFLFLRLHDKKNTLNVGEWSAGAEMIQIADGSFNYKVETRNLRRYAYYTSAWIEYQLVAVNENLEIIGRTQLYDHNISLMKCQPAP